MSNKNINACFSSNSVHWATPTKLYNYFISRGFTDVVPLYSMINFSDLVIQKNSFINPPFSELSLVTKCILDSLRFCRDTCKHIIIWLLLPARTDTVYFHSLFNSYFCTKLVFIKGRLHFNDSKKCAPFPTILMRFDSFHSEYYVHTYSVSMDDFESVVIS